MEENVALDSSKQKQFVKSLKGLKKLMKKSGAIPDKPEKKEIKPIQDGKVSKKRFKARGLVYLSHIPHGFYEHQMTEYFKQFGVVTNARVIRSKHTGRSKGHAFVEFKDTAVAQIVAETMNNYLMGKRLIKAVYIPPKDQRRNARRKNWNAQNNLGNKIRLNMKKAYNADKSENEELKIASKLLANLSNTKKKLKELGIDYDFFTPVDIPEGLSDKGQAVKEEKKEDKSNIDEKLNKKNKKEAVKRSTEMNETTDENIDETQNKQDEQKAKKKPKNQTKLNKTNDTPNDKKLSSISKSNSNTDNSKQNKKKIDGKKNKIVNEAEPEGNKHAQEQKQQKLKAAGVKPPEDFIKLGEDEDDSDSSYQFDSDEYENMINNEDESTDNDETDNDGDSNEELDISESKDLPPKSKNKGKQVIVQSVKPSEPKDKPKQESKQKPQQAKRKKPEKVAVQSKKPKFEKQSSKKLPNKQIKKK
ncbi:unnamed protein product [Parnassius apollo]|uniref:(apollo) hypothetical protein n=1 Tax=Parnassius apollo TaxID=110799 RepID=A0A8S3XV47_PARAO|nr:unnamed protein product [Parnassius apollo]